MKSFISKFELYFTNFAFLLFRIALSLPFWKSGLTKWSYIKNGQEDTLFFLFEEYNVPFLPVDIAAYMGTAAELILPILLVFGFLTRPAALGIIALSGVIYLADQNPSTYLWAASGFILFVSGAKKISLDHFFGRFCRK